MRVPDPPHCRCHPSTYRSRVPSRCRRHATLKTSRSSERNDKKAPTATSTPASPTSPTSTLASPRAASHHRCPNPAALGLRISRSHGHNDFAATLAPAPPHTPPSTLTPPPRLRRDISRPYQPSYHHHLDLATTSPSARRPSQQCTISTRPHHRRWHLSPTCPTSTQATPQAARPIIVAPAVAGLSLSPPAVLTSSPRHRAFPTSPPQPRPSRLNAATSTALPPTPLRHPDRATPTMQPQPRHRPSRRRPNHSCP